MRHPATLLLLAVAVAVSASAANITYNVNLTIGAGSVTGTIVTDGTIGTLGSANILDWNLLLNDGAATFDLTGPLSGSNSSVFSATNGLSATATQLLFTFSVANSHFELAPPSLDNDLCFSSTNCFTFNSGGSGESIFFSSFVSNTFVNTEQFTSETGTQAIATTVNGTLVPAVTNVTSSTANGTYTAGSTISILVTFSEAVTVTGAPKLALNSGGAANYSSGSGTATLTFTYTVGGSDSSAHLNYVSAGALTLNGGTIQDASSNNANLTLPSLGAAGSLGANTNIFIGTTPPPGSATYTYTGNYFNANPATGIPPVPAPYTTSDRVTGSFTVAAALGDNLSAELTPSTFSFSDGVQTITNSTAASVPDFFVSTNSAGQISKWFILADLTSPPGPDFVRTVNDGSGDSSINDLGAIGTTPQNQVGAWIPEDPGTWTATLNGFTGGTSSTPAYLPSGGSMAGITATIGGAESAAYYAVYWSGGAFSVSASIINANAGTSYLLSEGAVGGSCDSGETAALNSGDNFTSTIAIANLAPGFYCIGIDAINSGDPVVALTFNTPVTGAPAFFAGQVALGSNVEYLQFPDTTVFGYYTFVASTIFYHYDMGYEAFIPGSASDVYLYDFTSGHWWYTSNALFPYLYDFALNSWLYYFPNTQSPGRYTTNPRYFANLTTGQVFPM